VNCNFNYLLNNLVSLKCSKFCPKTKIMIMLFENTKIGYTFLNFFKSEIFLSNYLENV
jgi:hypothetical protein